MQVFRRLNTSSVTPCVATIGFFDGMHRGHAFLIDQVRNEALRRGLRSAVLTFPVHPRKILNPEFHPQLLTHVDEKLTLLEQSGVDLCFLPDFTPEMARMTAREFMGNVLQQACGVKALVIGYDHRFGHNRHEGFDDYVRHGRDLGMEVIKAGVSMSPWTDDEGREIPFSSSAIRNLLIQGDVDRAGQALGHPYAIEGQVTDGYRMGRKLGFPTANILPTQTDKLLPGEGVYATWVYHRGCRHKGMLNIGRRPTLDHGTHLSIEVHLLHFTGDLYGETLRIEFIHRLRAEQRFDNLQSLIDQLHRDAARTDSLLG